jgi:hypothetical protein
VRGWVDDFLFDLCPNTIRILHYIAGRKPNHLPTIALHRCRSTSIGLELQVMVLAVDLDHESSRYAGEVREVRTYWMLSSKFDASDAAVTEELPYLTLGPASVAAQTACSRGGLFVLGHDPLT